MAKKLTPQEFAATLLPEVPQYRLTEQAYIAGDKLLDAGELMYHTGRPEHYMEPANAAAEKMLEQFPVTYSDPITSIPLTNQPQREFT